MPNPTRISELTEQEEPQVTDQIPMARGAGPAGRTYKVIIRNLFNKIFKTADSPTVLLHFDPLTLTLSADASAAGILNTTNSPTIKLTYNTNTRNLSADLQKPLDLSSWANTPATKLTLPTYLETPPGAIMAFAGEIAPDGWLACDGNASMAFQPIPNGIGTFQNKTADFSRLYVVLGTTYGSAGTLPDLRGYFIRGFGVNADGTASNNTFGAKQADAFQGHKHDIYDPQHDHGITDNGHSHAGNTSEDGEHTHNMNFNKEVDPEGVGNSNQYLIRIDEGNDIIMDPAGEHSHSIQTSNDATNISINDGSTNISIQNPRTDQALGEGEVAGPGGVPRTSNETRPRNVSLLYCIKY